MTYRAILRLRRARAVIFSNALTNLGGWCFFVAMNALVLAQFGPVGVGLFNGARGALTFALTPLTGTLADRVDHRFLMMLGEALSAVASLGLAIAAMTDWFEPRFVVPLVALSSLSTAILGPARGAFLPSLVPAAGYQKLNSLNGLVDMGSMVVAPSIAALVVTDIGTHGLLLIDAASCVLSIALLTGLFAGTTPATTEPGGADVRTSALASRTETEAGAPAATWRDAIATVRRHPFLRAAVPLHLLAHAVGGTTFVALVSLSQRFDAPEAVAIGVLTASLGAGSSLGLVLGGRFNVGWGLPVIGLASCLTGLGFGAVGLSTMLASALAFLFALAVSDGSMQPLLWSGHQRATPEGVRGRVLGSIESTGNLLQYAGQGLAGSLIAVAGTTALLLGSGAAMLGGGAAVAIYGLRSSTRRQLPHERPDASLLRPRTGDTDRAEEA